MNRVKKFLLTTCVFASLAAVAIGVSACDTPQQEEHAHQWGNWTVATAPTDSAEGKATRTCSGEGTCDATAADKEYTLPALTGTDYSKDADSATCTTAGSVTYTYNKNGVSVSFDVTTSAKGHGTLALHEAKAANCIEDGTKAYWSCDDCGWLFSDAEGTTKIDVPVTDTAKGSHGELTLHPSAPATNCAGPGTKAYWSCDDCGWLFSDAEGTTKIDAPVAANHPNATITNAAAATCTEKGRAAYWTCPDCSKHFSDEACTREVTDLTSLDIDMVAHKLSFKEGVGATCDAEGVDDYWKCNTCETLFSDEAGTTTISAPVTHHKHPDAAIDDNIPTSKSVSGITFGSRTRYICPDCHKHIVVTGSSYEELSSDLIYSVRSGVGYWLFDKDEREIATVDMPAVQGGITFVAPETGIYTFTFGEGASISTVYYRQGTTNTIVYDDGWKTVEYAEYFDKTSLTLTNTLKFEVDKNSTVIVKLSSGKFSASYTYEKSTKAHLNRAFTVVPTATNKTATIVADVPAAGEYLVTISNLSMYMNSTAPFTVEVGTDSKTTTAGKPVSVTLSPDTQFMVTYGDTLYDTDEDGLVHYSHSYDVTITQIKGTLQMGDNPVNVTVANSPLYIDAYTFTAATAEDHTFTAPAGLTVNLPEKGVTIAAGSSGVVSLEADEKVIVVVSGAVNSYTLNISAGASYDPLPNTSTKISFSMQEVKTYSVPSNVVTEEGTYKITITMANPSTTPILFALNKADDYSTLYGTNSSGTEGTADVVYGGFGSFWKTNSGFTTSGAAGTFYITLTLKPGDTLTFASGYAFGSSSLGITVAKA